MDFKRARESWKIISMLLFLQSFSLEWYWPLPCHLPLLVLSSLFSNCNQNNKYLQSVSWSSFVSNECSDHACYVLYAYCEKSTHLSMYSVWELSVIKMRLNSLSRASLSWNKKTDKMNSENRFIDKIYLTKSSVNIRKDRIFQSWRNFLRGRGKNMSFFPWSLTQVSRTAHHCQDIQHFTSHKFPLLSLISKNAWSPYKYN